MRSSLISTALASTALASTALTSTTMAATAIAAVIMASATPAAAQAPTSPRAYSVPAGELEQALQDFVSQSGQRVLYSSQLVSGLSSPGVSGNLPPEEALRTLLSEAGLEFRRTEADVLVLFDPLVSSDLRGSATTVDDVVVTGSLIRGLEQGSSPVIVIDRNQIDRDGHATVAQALAALPQNFGGSANEAAIDAGADRTAGNSTYANGVNLRGLGSDATLVLINGRRLAGTGISGDFTDLSSIPASAVKRIDVLLDGASALYGPHNTLLDNCAVYTAFSALDPLTQEKISRLTGQVLEIRTSRSRAAGWGSARASVSQSGIDRPLLEPGEARILPSDIQLTFAADARPLRTTKLCYDRREPFRSRARIPRIEAGDPGPPAPHPWKGRRALGERPRDMADDRAAPPAYDEAEAQRAWREGYAQEARDRGAQEAALDFIQGKRP